MPLCPIVFSSAEEKTSAIDWPVVGIDPKVETDPAEIAYGGCFCTKGRKVSQEWPIGGAAMTRQIQKSPNP